jgi:hypothetical protein
MKVQSSHLVALFRHVSETVTVEFHPSGPNPRWALMRASGAYGEAVGLLLVHHVLTSFSSTNYYVKSVICIDIQCSLSAARGACGLILGLGGG